MKTIKLPGGVLYNGDCLKVMHKLYEKALANYEKNWFDLIFCDPPYNIGHKYDVYQDNLTNEEYQDWCDHWLSYVYHILKPGGALWCMCHSSYLNYFQRMMNHYDYEVRNTIIWRYTFGQAQTKKFTPSWVPLIYAAKPDAPFTFNADSVRVPSDRQTKYHDKRANPKGKVPDDVWDDIPRLCGTFREREEHPCQLPEKLLERIILACTNKGEKVLDPFSGSGVSLAVARRLKRKFTGIELSPNYCALIKKRLEKDVKEEEFQFQF